MQHSCVLQKTVSTTSEALLRAAFLAARYTLMIQCLCRSYPCVIITAKGQPDVGTRLFLKKIVDKLAIPVMALMDADPYGERTLNLKLHERRCGNNASDLQRHTSQICVAGK